MRSGCKRALLDVAASGLSPAKQPKADGLGKASGQARLQCRCWRWAELPRAVGSHGVVQSGSYSKHCLAERDCEHVLSGDLGECRSFSLSDAAQALPFSIRTLRLFRLGCRWPKLSIHSSVTAQRLLTSCMGCSSAGLLPCPSACSPAHHPDTSQCREAHPAINKVTSTVTIKRKHYIHSLHVYFLE